MYRLEVQQLVTEVVSLKGQLSTLLTHYTL